eukprot:2073264-Rhodomonas_salina.1
MFLYQHVKFGKKIRNFWQIFGELWTESSRVTQPYTSTDLGRNAGAETVTSITISNGMQLWQANCHLRVRLTVVLLQHIKPEGYNGKRLYLYE